jgi:hypothetical protein
LFIRPIFLQAKPAIRNTIADAWADRLRHDGILALECRIGNLVGQAVRQATCIQLSSGLSRTPMRRWR